MTIRQAVKRNCLDCAGESQKELTLCTVFSCPLWPFRTGESPAQYNHRMAAARKNYAKELAEMERSGIDTAAFYQDAPSPKAEWARNLSRRTKRAPFSANEQRHRSLPQTNSDARGGSVG